MTESAAQARPRSLSIIVNNYNYATFVGAAIDSALSQTTPAQVIVVDDGSTDGSRAVIESFGRRVQAVFKDNGGQASALNAGFALATGDLVIFLDADDRLEPHAVATVLREWRHGTVLGQYAMTIIDARDVASGVYPDPPSILADGDVRQQLLATGRFGLTMTSGAVFARSALSLVMPMPEPEFVYCADGYLLRSVAFLGRVQRIDGRLACYRVHGANFSDLRATAGGLAAGFRKKIRVSQREFEVTREFAARSGLSASPELGEHDPDFLGYRLFSLLLDPGQHPIEDDRRVDLLTRYTAARWTSPWSASRRATAIAVALTATLGPPSSAARLIQWLHDPTTRPEWLRAVAAAKRRRRSSPSGPWPGTASNRGG